MKKNFYIILGLFFIFSCSKKDKLQINTLELSISPSPVVVEPTKKIELTCSGKSAKSDNVDINPIWTVEPETLGTFSPTRGKKVNFTASNQTGQGKIRATEGDVYKEVKLTITQSTQTNGGGGGESNRMLIYSDSGMNDKLDFAFYYFDTNNEEPWQITTNDSSPGYDVDPQKCVKVDYTDQQNGFGGFYLKFKSPQDLSSYSKLTFYVKGKTGGEMFKIGIKDSNSNEYKKTITATSSWQKVEIDLSEFVNVNKQSISLPFILAFENVLQSGDKTIYIDLIQYE
ncbi:MAG: CIA30 family protein [Endomicrobiia bacterium]